ncbi:MAG: HEPN domain-containing protein [Ignavibacteriae bacterium]|nr:MAG: HEPN domain-containing protein [Ignavibacteriota bacterium]
MNRSDLQKISKIRLKEARELLHTGNYNGAYYLCGYAIECALKSCIAKKTNKYDFPDKKLANKSFTHELRTLMDIAGLSVQFENEKSTNVNFSAKWLVVKDWNEDSRYEFHDKNKAENMYNAIASRNGILKWIKQHW